LHNHNEDITVELSFQIAFIAQVIFQFSFSASEAANHASIVSTHKVSSINAIKDFSSRLKEVKGA